MLWRSWLAQESDDQQGLSEAHMTDTVTCPGQTCSHDRNIRAWNHQCGLFVCILIVLFLQMAMALTVVRVPRDLPLAAHAAH